MKNITFATVSAFALALTACADDDPVEAPAADADLTTNADTMMDDAMPLGGDLSEDQQANYDSMDRQAVSDEYDANRGAMVGSSSESEATMSEADNSGAMDTSMSDESTPSMTLPSRSQMDFAFLDRNGDGMLSVAEYAIWAVRANPATPVENDEAKPYITPDQINEAGQTFFYFDEDGSTYLSPSEFTSARNSAMTPTA
ncbi:hypothetical protein [Aurantiacibacter suaedae]|uniref:hypothetical protein n=1 Tax=Aurantiacibacter suaedae TaxID=2545755 RepID=UPI0010F4787D|nr:hypothetical protein [Aurantiacibacter suaedae]